MSAQAFLPISEGEMVYGVIDGEVVAFIALRQPSDDRLAWFRVAAEPTVLEVE